MLWVLTLTAMMIILCGRFQVLYKKEVASSTNFATMVSFTQAHCRAQEIMWILERCYMNWRIWFILRFRGFGEM